MRNTTLRFLVVKPVVRVYNETYQEYNRYVYRYSQKQLSVVLLPAILPAISTVRGIMQK